MQILPQIPEQTKHTLFCLFSLWHRNTWRQHFLHFCSVSKSSWWNIVMTNAFLQCVSVNCRAVAVVFGKLQFIFIIRSCSSYHETKKKISGWKTKDGSGSLDMPSGRNISKEKALEEKIIQCTRWIPFRSYLPAAFSSKWLRCYLLDR